MAIAEGAAETNPLQMSDEDFLNMAAPAVTTEEVAKVETPEIAEVVTTGEDTQVDTAAGEASMAATAGQDTLVGGEGDDTISAGTGADTTVGKSGTDTLSGGSAADAVAGDKKDAVVLETGAMSPEDFYKKVMTPFKANGKTIELKTPAEAIQLMQMGANYTRKMQGLAPHMKALTMLQNNGLLEEDKLSFLIDLDKKNPEAIKKLLKDSGIDPLEIDTTTEPAYLQGNHRVTDEEVNLRSALDELGSTPDGKATLHDINTRWDDASKDVLWKHPEMMATIHSQREYGIYDRIVAEVDRQTTLGTIPAGTPFLQAYKTVGDQLTEADAFADLREKHTGNAAKTEDTPPGQEGKVTGPTAVATRVVPPKSPVANGEAASAASATRTTPKKVEEFINPLAMSDEEFLKSFEGRL